MAGCGRQQIAAGASPLRAARLFPVRFGRSGSDLVLPVWVDCRLSAFYQEHQLSAFLLPVGICKTLFGLQVTRKAMFARDHPDGVFSQEQSLGLNY